MSGAYRVRDGDGWTDLPGPGRAVWMDDRTGWCELCNCFRRGDEWHWLGQIGSGHCCARHPPMERQLWRIAQGLEVSAQPSE